MLYVPPLASATKSVHVTNGGWCGGDWHGKVDDEPQGGTKTKKQNSLRDQNQKTRSRKIQI